eukprot:2374448-Rhodomonas_salina.1
MDCLSTKLVHMCKCKFPAHSPSAPTCFAMQVPSLAVYSPRRRSRNAFKALKARQQRYQLSIKPWSQEDMEFKF